MRDESAELKNLSRPEETLEFELGRADLVELGEVTVGRTVLEPGWRWSSHIRPIVGTEWCRSSHLGIMESGRIHIVLESGQEMDAGPGDVYSIPPGHDAWVVGDEPAVQIEWSGVRGWLEPLESSRGRVLTTLVFTDIVDSTATAARMGDAKWRELLNRHNGRVRELLGRFGGREVKTTGDGFLLMFDGAARALRFALAVTASSASEGLETRAGAHTGEVEVADGDVHGIAVHECARLLGFAGPGETVVTQLTKDLVGSAGFAFEDRGDHELKGLDVARRLFAVRPGGS